MAASFQATLLRNAMASSAKRSAFGALRAQAIQRATFQTSSARAILPALPQSVKGTINDPAPVPHAHPTHGSYHWTMER